MSRPGGQSRPLKDFHGNVPRAPANRNERNQSGGFRANHSEVIRRAVNDEEDVAAWCKEASPWILSHCDRAGNLSNINRYWNHVSPCGVRDVEFLVGGRKSSGGGRHSEQQEIADLVRQGIDDE